MAALLVAFLGPIAATPWAVVRACLRKRASSVPPRGASAGLALFLKSQECLLASPLIEPGAGTELFSIPHSSRCGMQDTSHCMHTLDGDSEPLLEQFSYLIPADRYHASGEADGEARSVDSGSIVRSHPRGRKPSGDVTLC